MENNKRNHDNDKKRKSGLNNLSRKGVEHGFAVISIMIIVPVFFTAVLLLTVLPRPEISEIEKRELAKMPEFTFESYFSGEYTADVAEHYDDTVPFRDDLKNVGYNFKSIFGIHNEDEVKVVGKPSVVTKPDNDKDETSESSKHDTSENSKNETQQSSSGDVSENRPEESSAETSDTSVQESTEPEEVTVENGIIVVKSNGHYRALELFGGGSGSTYAQALNDFHKDLGDSVKIYSMVAPLASEYYTPSSYSDFNASQRESIESIKSKLDKDIVSIDITDVLGQHKDEDIYFRTDHHWTPLGAYYAAEAFAKTAGLDFKDLSTYKKNDMEGFVGTMYGFTGDANLNNDPELFSYYTPDNVDKCMTYYYTTDFQYTGKGRFFNGVGDIRSAYLTFMGGDEQIVKVKTNIKNGKKLLIVKDSYGNAIPGYLFGSYEEIYVVDMRYFGLNLVDFVKQNNVTDMLFTMVSYSAVGGNADNLENLRTQAKGKKIVDEGLKDEE